MPQRLLDDGGPDDDLITGDEGAKLETQLQVIEEPRARGYLVTIGINK